MLVAEGTNEPQYSSALVLDILSSAALTDCIINSTLLSSSVNGCRHEVRLSGYLSVIFGSVCQTCHVSCL